MGNEVSAAKVGISDENNKERRRTVIASSSTSKKVSNFTYYYPNWESYLDDSGNTYYYNQITKETRWNPAEIYEIPVSVMDQVDETQEEWDSPAPSLGTMGKTVSRSVMTDYYEKRARQIQERQESVQNDPFSPWKELSEIGHFEYEAMEDHIEEATSVVLEVSSGNFEPELLYKLPWAYKLQQLSAAVKDSYLQLGDMLDSSKYDNCNDVPRYDNGGLLAWWMDLEEMHSCVDIVLQSGVVGQEADAYSEEMKKLQEIASSSNEEEIIEGFLARKNAVEKELDGLRARCFAVVSLESGPTREQLDNLYMYLKDNVNNGTNLDDIQDEMEEVVSSWLEQKHRFMVDVVLMMGLLEDEHERLQKRIASFNGNGHSRIRKNGENDDENAMAIENIDSGDDEYEEDLDTSREEGLQSNDIYDENGEQIMNNNNNNQNLDGTNDQMFSSTNEFTTQQLPENFSTTSLQQINGELTQSMIIENTPENGIEAQLATPMITTSIDKSVLNLDKSIVASKIAEQDAEAKRLAEELAYQKEQRAKSLQDRLAKKKAQRTQELIEEENLDIETAKLKAEVEVAEELAIEEDEFNNNLLESLSQKDLEIKEKLNQICDEETERITKESEIERDTKIQEIKKYYEEEKKKREIEIIDELGCTIEAAAALAEDEIDIKENSDISKIEKDIAEKTEKRRLAVVESIRNEHLKASNLLESELQNQKDQKVKSLKNRLEKRKEIRTNELLNSGMQVHEAVAIADLEVKTKLQVEQKKVEEDIQQKLEETKQKTVQTLKEVQEKEATRLEQDLLFQETRQKKALHERLQKREKKREQALKSEGVNEEEAKKIAELEQKKAEEEAIIKLEQEIKEIKAIQETEAQKLMEYHTTKKESQQKTLKDRLAKRKAKKETELSPEEKLEQFMKTIREKQKINLEKLNQFIESEKIKLISLAERQDQEDMGTGQHVMQTMFLFGLVKESLINGYKKQCVYQVRSIKELQKLEKLSPNEHNKAMFTASEQLIIQHCRDLKSLMDTQITEQQRARVKLEEDCAPMDKIIDMEEKYYKRNIDSLRKQQSKLSLALAGVHINMDWLIMKENSKKKEFIDDDEDDIFGDNNNVQQDLWSDEICQWFEGSLSLQNIYDKVPEALLSKFQSIMLQYKAQVLSGEASASDLPVVGAVLYQVTLVLLKAISESYQAQISDSSSVNRYTMATPDDIKPYIIQAVENARSNLSLEAAFNTMDANQSIQSKFKKALQEFLENPTVPTPEFNQILQILKVKAQPVVQPPPQEVVTPSQKIIRPKETIQIVDDNEERKNRMIKSIETRVERKRRDIQERYRKRMDQKIHECKDAKIDLPEDFASEEEKLRKEELNNLSLALEEVKDLVHNNSDSLQSVSVDGLMHAIEKKLKGEEIETTDLKQLEIEAAKENEKAEAKRLLKMQKDEAEKLDVMLKVQRAREQQALQKRLLARKSKGQK